MFGCFVVIGKLDIGFPKMVVDLISVKISSRKPMQYTL